jgi:hypothetical protein
MRIRAGTWFSIDSNLHRPAFIRPIRFKTVPRLDPGPVPCVRPDCRVAVELETVRLRLSIFRLRQKSLARGTILALASLWISFRLSGFPEVHVCLWLIAPLLVACAATWDTTRCLQRRWNFYHGGVILLIYVDLMVVLMISFLLLAPYSSVFL